MNETITHIAGPMVVINGRGIQRCAVCGEKLMDTIGTMICVAGRAEEVQQLAQWPEGEYVQVDGDRMSVVREDYKKNYPKDGCLSLVEA